MHFFGFILYNCTLKTIAVTLFLGSYGDLVYFTQTCISGFEILISVEYARFSFHVSVNLNFYEFRKPIGSISTLRYSLCPPQICIT